MNKILCFLVLIILLQPSFVFSQDKEFKPRYASLSSSLINLRTGPGKQYPIDWVYKKRDYPIEIIAEYDIWRKIKEIDGTEGWVHQAMLSSRRYGIVTEKAMLTRKKESNSQVIAFIEPKVIVKIVACPKESLVCRVETKGKHGFISRKSLWGTYPNENF